MDNIRGFFEKVLGLPKLASAHGKDVDTLIIYVHLLMAALFIGWIVYYAYVLLRFRKSRNPKADYFGVRNHASTGIELAVVLVEAVLLIGFAVPLWGKAVDRFPKEADATVIRLAAQQFAWNGRYAGKDGKFGKQDVKLVTAENPLGVDKNDADAKDDVQVLNEMHVPVNKPVIVYVSSRDVIHSFKVIAFRVTQDAIPGMAIPVHFTPTVAGKFQINCAQLCGNGHASMSSGLIVVETQAEYDKWLAEKAGAVAVSYE